MDTVPLRLRRAVFVALLHALPVTALTTTAAALYAAPAAAQTRTVTTNRLLDVWRTGIGSVYIERYGVQQYTAWVTCNGETKRAYVAHLTATADGLAIEGPIVPYQRASGAVPIGRVRIAFDETGRRIVFTMDGNRLHELARLTGESTGVQPWLERRFRGWFGTWQTDFGTLTLQPEGAHIVGTATLAATPGQPARTVTVALAPDEYYKAEYLDGAWEERSSGSRSQGRVVWNLDETGTKFTGNRTDEDGAPGVPWNGERVVADLPPAPPAEPPSPQAPPATPPSTQPSPPATPPASPPTPAPSAFKPLRRYDVRLDRLVEARGYPTRQVHAFVTVRNVSGQPQYVTSGFLRAVLTDADGVAQEKNQVWRANGEPAALFASTPVVQPGAELKVRYVFTPAADGQVTGLTLSEGDTRAEFPTSGF